jgi:hypothetical protein
MILAPRNVGILRRQLRNARKNERFKMIPRGFEINGHDSLGWCGQITAATDAVHS